MPLIIKFNSEANKFSLNKKDEYISFCKKELDLPIFSQPWYLDLVCGSNNWDIIIVKKGTEIAATIPSSNKNKFGFHISRMPILCKYLGPYFTKKFRSIKQQEKLMRTIVEQLPNFDFFDQNFYPSITNCLPFLWEGFEATPKYTYMIDLSQDLDEIYGNISPNYRNNKIKKAKKIVTIHTTENLEEFHFSHLKTFEKQKMKDPFTLDYLKKYDNVLKRQKSRCIFLAKDSEGNIHSTLYLIWDKNTAYTLMAGNDLDFGNSGAGVFITWHSIKYAKEVLQKKNYDFSGSVIENISKVRQEMGAEQIPYFNVQKFGSKALEFFYRIK